MYNGRTLKSISPDTGEIVWEGSFSGLSKESLKIISGAPYFLVENGGSFTILDANTGEVKLRSSESPIQVLKKYNYFPLSNHILISGKDHEQKSYTVLKSLSSGKIMWKESDNELVDAHQLENGDIVLSSRKNVYRINPESGEQLWKSNISEEKARKLLGFEIIIGSNKVKISKTNLIKHPSKPIVYVGEEMQKSEPTPADPNNVLYTMHYVAFDLNTGNYIWKEPLTAAGKLRPLLFTEEGIISHKMINFSNKVNLMQYDSTKTGMWGNKKNGVNVKGTLTNFSNINTGTFLFSQYREGSGFLYFVSKETGMPDDGEIKLDGDLNSIKDFGANVFVLTSAEATVLKLIDAKYKVTETIETSPSLVAENEETIFIYDVKESMIKAMNKKTGALIELSKKIKLKGKEDITHIKLIKEGIILNSLQEIFLFGYSGDIKYHKYYEAPKKSDVTEKLESALQLRHSYENFSNENFANTDDELVLEFCKSKIEYKNVTIPISKKYIEKLDERLGQIKDNQHFTYVIRGGEVNTFMKINLSTGEPVEEVSLGSEKRPDYLIDAITGYLYLITEDKILKVFKL
ncbi:hypothetical protein GCM10009122_05100 [Fulvivirga kasyanovii]